MATSRKSGPNNIMTAIVAVLLWQRITAWLSESDRLRELTLMTNKIDSADYAEVGQSIRVWFDDVAVCDVAQPDGVIVSR
jgi:hypothetical protein